MKHQSFFGILMTIWAAVFCTTVSATKPPKAVVIFVDQTSSISEAEAARWRNHFDAYLQAVDHSKGIDSYTIRLLPLHANTYNAAPIIQDANFSMRKGIKYRRKRKMELKRLREGFEKMLHVSEVPHVLSEATDIYSSIDRATTFFAGHREALKEIRYYSDMIHYTPSEPLLSQEFKRTNDLAPLVEAVIQRHGWNAQTLKGVQVVIIKPGVTNQTAGDQEVSVELDKKVNRFWRLLFEKLGAAVETIENV